jgi:HD-like signal output (HDOD) protein
MTSTPSTSALQQLVERSRRLYSLPAVALEVIELTGQPQADPRALKTCIERDPALTCRILRVVNSSLFGLSRQVSDLNQALALLGIKPLKMLVLGFSLPKQLLDQVEADTLRYYWQHTLVKAVACRLLCERIWKTSGDEPFIAGLLQDLGELVLIQDLGPSYIRFLQHVRSQGGNLLALELETLGFDHAVLSSRLLDHWGLPANLAAAVAVPLDATHIASLPADEQALPRTLHLAEAIASFIEKPGPESLQPLLDLSAAYGPLNYDQLQSLLELLQSQVKQLAEVLALELPEHTPYVELLRAAHEQLSDVASEAAVELLSLGPERRILAETDDLRNQLQKVLRAPIEPPPQPPPAAPPTAAEPKSQPTSAKPPAALQSVAAVTAADPGLKGRIAGAVTNCRQGRRPLTFALVQVDQWDQVLIRRGPQQALQLLHMLEKAIGQWTNDRGSSLTVGEALFAIVWEDCQRGEAIDLIRLLIRAVKSWQPLGDHQPAFTLSAGLATIALPPKNFPAHDLVEAARRCLSGAQLSGGDSYKSIEL